MKYNSKNENANTKICKQMLNLTNNKKIRIGSMIVFVLPVALAEI